MLFGLFFKEGIYLKRFRKLLREINWSDLKIKSSGFAANGSLLYLLLKIYIEIKPTTILELGSGQSSKLALRYITENEKSSITTLEDNVHWYKILKENLCYERFNYLHRPLKKMKVNDFYCDWYSVNSTDIHKDSNFTLLIVDGPFGTKHNSRAGIVSYLPDILNNDDFIIILDDTSRKGEQDTINLIETKFKLESLSYIKRNLYGYKKQTCLFSNNHQNFFDNL